MTLSYFHACNIDDADGDDDADATNGDDDSDDAS